MISRPLIVRELFENSTDHGNDVMVAQFVFLFLSRAMFREISTEMDVKTFKVIVKNKSTTIFHGLYSYHCLMDHRNDI